MEINYKLVGERIRTARELAEMSQQELASKLQVSTAAISMYESGERKPSLEFIISASKALGVSVQEIVEGYERKPMYVSFRADADNEKLQSALKKALQSINDDLNK